MDSGAAAVSGRAEDMQDASCGLPTMLLGSGVKIALAAARFSWFRGGPARAMGHLGE